ncbi:MAG: hypothetical protein L0287_34820, partial [Anaerolineae bacterium]|nr:hypothetical protein [Anaerolineae bacterium]
MFAIKPRKEIFVRVLLIAAFLFNAFAPSAAVAKAASNDDTTRSLNSQGMKGSAIQSFAMLRARTALQITPTSTTTSTDIPTAPQEPSVTLTGEITPTPPVSPTLESTPT